MVPKRLPWVHTASAQPGHQRLDVVGPGVGGEVEVVVAIVGPSAPRLGHDGVAHRAPHQVEGVTGRSEAVGQLGGGLDQRPQSLGEHAAEGSATGVGCRPKWIGNEAACAPAAAIPGPACRSGTGPPRSSGWVRRGARTTVAPAGARGRRWSCGGTGRAGARRAVAGLARRRRPGRRRSPAAAAQSATRPRPCISQTAWVTATRVRPSTSGAAAGPGTLPAASSGCP